MRLEHIARKPKTEHGRIVWLLASMGSPVSEIATATGVGVTRLLGAMQGASLSPCEDMRLSVWLTLVHLRLRARSGHPATPEEQAEAWRDAILAGLAGGAPPLKTDRSRGA